MQLTSIIGELSDILGKVTTYENGQYLDENTRTYISSITKDMLIR